MSFNRRDFLKGSVLIGGVAAVAAATGCSPQATDSSAEAAEETTSDWRTPPEPIADSDIATVEEADIVVVGAGVAGIIAAVSAVEENASVIVLQKNKEIFCHGFQCAANGTKLQKELGISYDSWEIMHDLDFHSENKSKPEVVRNWVKYSGEVADWIYDNVNGVDGVGPIELIEVDPADDDWNYTWRVTYSPVGNIEWNGGFPSVLRYLSDNADPNLLSIHYNTPGVQLRTDESGRVTGVVGKSENGYILANAKKAVILCAGDYGNDLTMRDEFMPFVKGLPVGYANTDDTGDGHKMATWVGAAMEPEPHACNIHYDPGIGVPDYHGTVVPWLRVNLNGERFSNEDQPYELLPEKDMLQPEFLHFQVFDDNWKTDWKDMGRGGFLRADWDELVPRALEAGDLHTGNTLAELAESMGVPVDAFEATVRRYNELCEKGYDEDFGKQARRLKKVEKAPFYAFKRRASCLTPLGGLSVNGDMQVLNENEQPIEGLYAAGNCSGNFFGGFVQRMRCSGFGVGRAAVTGRVAAKRATNANY